jgi:hypothetical protein
MKKIMFSLLAATAFLLAGCFETTEEVTINADGSGNYTNTNDMSAIIGMLKAMGGEEAEQMKEMRIDTSFSLATLVDSIPSLTDEEKTMMKNGKMKMKVDVEGEKATFSMNFPFTSVSEVTKYNALAGKLMGETMKKQLSGPDAGPLGNMPEQSSMESYYELSFKNGQIKRKLNKDKYAGVGSDEYLTGMKEASQMGIPITTTQVYNLPRPAKKVEGQNVTLSADKKTVTVKSTLNEFFDEAEKLEFEIEY